MPGIATGSIIKKANISSLGGEYLVCDGSAVSKTTYSALYAAIGDTYKVKEYKYINASPWRDQPFNTASNSTVISWASGPTLPDTISSAMTFITKDRVYVCGGYKNATTAVNTVYTATIDANGVLGSFTNSGLTLPVVQRSAAVLMTRNRVYLCGGVNSSGTSISTVHTAPINADGTLGTFTTGTALPGAVSIPSGVINNNKAYLIGGQSPAGTAISTVYSTTVNQDGTIGAWSTDIPVNESFSGWQPAATKSRVYFVGGFITSGGAASTVRSSILTDNGMVGDMSHVALLPSLARNAPVVATSSRIYSWGGTVTAGQGVTATYNAALSPDGVAGTWVSGGTLPAAFGASSAIVTSSRVYLIAGIGPTANVPVNSTYYCLFNGGKNDYISPGNSYIEVPDSNSFNLPNIPASSSNPHIGPVYSVIKV